MKLLSRLEQIRDRWEQVGEKLSNPEIVNDMKQYTRLNKEYSELGDMVEIYRRYKDLLSNISNNKKILQEEKDEELRDMAKEELQMLEEQVVPLEEEIKFMLIPKDPEDEKDALLEIRSGTGGDEAALFAGDLYKMYQRYCDLKGWQTEVVSISEGTAGGYKEVVMEVHGAGVYGLLKYESGVHRVQRVPQTETQGRVHTSAATVAVLPEAEEVDVQINDKDIRKDTFRSSGAGGQHVNKTDSAIRLTHIPTGVVVECQEERSQIKNLEKAMKVLRTRLYEAELERRNQATAAKRKTMVSTGDRSAKIRTYNYPQGRVTDHRIGMTVYNLDDVLNGEIQEFINALQVAENTERLKEGGVEIG